jgi:hypothetical protein
LVKKGLLATKDKISDVIDDRGSDLSEGELGLVETPIDVHNDKS